MKGSESGDESITFCDQLALSTFCAPADLDVLVNSVCLASAHTGLIHLYENLQLIFVHADTEFPVEK